MIVDPSALVAILRAEPEAALFIEQLLGSRARMSSVGYVETCAVIDRIGDPILSRAVDELLELARVTIEPVSVEQARLARSAYRDFGKGSGHPAGLNLGDTFSYALAKATGEPLLFKGDDFSHTDVLTAL